MPDIVQIISRCPVLHVRRIGLILQICVLALNASACARSELSAQQRASWIQKLERAKRLDEADAADLSVTPVHAADSIGQANKAGTVIAQLRRGEDVSQSEIDDALEIPPKSLSTETRVEMINKLNEAERRDELGEQYHDPSNDWLACDSYREQRERADLVLKALETGEEVPWSEIQQALRVPGYR